MSLNRPQLNKLANEMALRSLSRHNTIIRKWYLKEDSLKDSTKTEGKANRKERIK
jgi:hypothetical protein